MKKVFLGLAAGLMLFVFTMSPVSAQFWGNSSAPKADEAPVNAPKPGDENWNDTHKDVDKDVGSDVDKGVSQDEGCVVPQGNANSNANSNHNMKY